MVATRKMEIVIDGHFLLGCISLYMLCQTRLDGYNLNSSVTSRKKFSKFSMSNFFSIVHQFLLFSVNYILAILGRFFFVLFIEINFLLTSISSNITLALVYCDRLVLSSISSIVAISLCEYPSIAYKFSTVL